MEPCGFDSCRGLQCISAGCDKPRYRRSTRCGTCCNTLKRYGLTEPERDRILELQQGKCAICKTAIVFDGKPAKMSTAHIDHCHATNKVRGILCGYCNVLVGTIENRSVDLDAIRTYLG